MRSYYKLSLISILLTMLINSPFANARNYSADIAQAVVAKSQTIGTINKSAAASVISDQYKCNGQTTTTVNFSGINKPTWTNSNPGIGVPASGDGTIPNSYLLSNNTETIVRGIITVFEDGQPHSSFSIYVYPVPSVNTVGDVEVCNNQTQSSIIFSSRVEGTIFSWSIDNPGIGLGLAPNGTGNLPAFIAVNNTGAPITATVTVTATNAAGCGSSSSSFTITVNPSTQVNQPSNYVFCNEQISTVNFSTPNTVGTTTYSWTNDNTNIGLASSGSGDIFFISKNPDTKPITANIKVTPYNDEGCPGVSKTFKITINPTAQVNQPLNQLTCSSEPVGVNFSTNNTEGTTTYYWENTNSTIGLPASGNGNISFNALNTGTIPVSATIVVTPTYYNDGKSCTGPAKTFTITVNPSGQVIQPENMILCSGQFTTVGFDTDKKNGTTTYNWTNNNTNIGLYASGSGNISFTSQNQGTSPATATITVTPVFENDGVSCAGPSKTFTITVNPVAQMVKPADMRICSGQSTSVDFATTNAGGSMSYRWTNNNASIGLPATGTGNISFISQNAGTTPVTAIITVTPSFSNGGVICSGESKTFTIIVNPAAQVNQPADMIVCNEEITSVDFESENTSGITSYVWSNNNSSIGLASNGTGNINSFVASNTTTAPVTAIITVTPTYSGGNMICSGLEKSFKITVNPKAQVNQPENEIVCNEQPVFVDFETVNSGGTTTYSWKNDNPLIGLATSGAGDLSFVAKNTGTTPLTTTITVTPTFSNGGSACTGESKQFTITINPQSAQVNQPADLVVCNNQFTAVDFSTVNTGGITTYSWINDKPGIGLAASGNGNISFTAQNTGSAPVIATIMVTPSYTNGGIVCTGVAKTFKITVNPTAQVNQPTDVVVCNTQTASVAFGSSNTGGTTTYAWTNDNPGIGLASSGTGDIYSFTALNSGTSPVIANITVTPTYKNGATSCSGSPKTFRIVVNPTGQIIQPAEVVTCNNQLTVADFSSMNTGGITTYTWTNDNPAIGLAASGTGGLSFNARNTGFVPVTANVTVIPIFNNGGAGCPGLSKTFTITVNPSAQVNQPKDLVVCNEQMTDVLFETINTGGTTTYTWTNDTPGIGLTANGSGNIKSFTARNTGTTPVKATIIVTPTYINGSSSCPGVSKTFTITVNPSAQINQPANKIICNDEPTVINFSSANTGGLTSYSWTNDNTAIGLTASGTGNLSFITRNTGTTPLSANITVTPTFSNGGVSCSGLSKTFTITINPVFAQVNQPADLVLCSNQAGVVNFSTINSGGETSYTWTNDKPGIGLPAAGNGNISFTAQNTGSDPVVATILVTPSYTNGDVVCTGIAKSFKITINPTAQVNQPSDKTVCSGQATQVSFSTMNAGGTTTYTWTNDNPLIGLSASGNGGISFSAQNSGTKPITANIRVTPAYGNGDVSCSGSSKTFTITVNPIGQVFKPANIMMCSNDTKTVNFATQNTGGTTTYAWTNNNTEIGLVASGSGDITFTSQNLGSKPITATITVTPTFNNGGSACSGIPENFTITVDPVAQVNQPLDMVVCNEQVSDVNFETMNTGGTTTYSWTNDTPGIGLAANGSGNIKSFTARNTGTSPLKATITVTPTYINGGISCIGESKTFTITVNPAAQVVQPTNRILCNGEPTSISFSSTNTGGVTTYTWTNDNIAIGLAASGVNGLSFMTRNTGTTPITANIVVTPTFTNGGISCTGESKAFTITINPLTAQVDQPADLVLCNSQAGVVEFRTINSGGETTYTWTNDKPANGLAAAGSGNIAFTAQNSGSAPIVATVMVTPIYTNGGVVCTGVAKSFKITVNPVAQVNRPSDRMVCSGQATQVSFSTSNTGGATTYSWTNDNPQIGLSASGDGNISFTALNASTKPITANIRVIPSYSYGDITCTGPAQIFTITVNPIGQVFKPADVVMCSNETKTVSFATQNTVGTTSYSWTNSNAEIGLAASGNGDITFTSRNAGTKPEIATITVTPTFNNGGSGCPGKSETFTITVNPLAQVNQPSDVVVCNEQVSDINFETSNMGGTTTYSWTNDSPGIGLASSGTGSIKSFTPRNTGTSPLKATITVTPTYINGGISCSGDSKIFTITINPAPQVNQPTNKIICNEEPTTISFSTINTGGTTTYTWTNDNTAIGLDASGTGNLSFMTRNNGTSPATATVVVTPIFSTGGVSCTGESKTFTITVNPVTAQVNQPTDLVLCNNQAGIVAFETINTGGTTTYSWTNDKPGIGLAASGSGNISFTAQNTGSAPIVATILVTPYYTNGDVVCTGVARSFKITVNPFAQVNQPADRIVCSGQTAQVSFSTSNTGSTTTYSWTNDNPQIGLSTSGNGNISFTALNASAKPVTAHIRVTPTYSNGDVSCTGPAQTFTFTVNPDGQVYKPSDIVMCSNETKTVSFNTQNSGGATSYSWTNNNPEIGLAASGSGDITFTSQNSGVKPITATITVTPTFNNGISSCSGTPETFTITVNPVAQINQPADVVVCNEQLSDINFETSNVGGTTTYSWTNDSPGIGLASSGTGSIKSFTPRNTGTSPLKATITVTPTYINGGISCSGESRTFTITINPAPQVDQPTNKTICNEEPTTISFSTINTGGTTTYSWTNDNTAIGLDASGTGNLSFMTRNTGTTPATATVVVTPIFNNGGVSCTGESKIFTITVNPVKAQVNQPTDLVLCNNQVGVVEFGTVNTGGETTYTWTNDKPGIGLAVSGNGNISFTAQNAGSAPVIATILVTPSYTNGDVVCTGVAKAFRITVNPVAQVNEVSDKIVCNGQLTTVGFTTSNTGGATTYTWTNDNPNIGLSASGNGNITFSALNTGTKPILANVTVTPAFNNGSVGCAGPAQKFTITVNPSGQVVKPADMVMCSNETTTVNFTTLNTGGTTSYVWTNSNSGIGLSASGSGNIAFTSQSTGTKPVTATITVTPTFSNGESACPGTPQTFTITVNPVAQVNQSADQVVCDGQPVDVNFTTVNTGGTTSYTWKNDNTSIGLSVSGSDNLSFVARNNTTSPLKSTITVTPVFTNGGEICQGSAKTFTITVNPVAQVIQPVDQLLCNEEPTIINFSTVNTGGTPTYSWTNNNPGIGLPVSGTGNISFVTKNPGTVPVTATITVTPTYSNGGVSCTGEARSFTLTVNPVKAQVNQPEDRVICNEQPVSVGFSTVNSGGTTTYFWTNDNPAIGLDASGSGDISFISRNTGTTPVVAIVMVTPSYTNGDITCTGVAKTFKITVNPTPQINQPSNVAVCNNETAVVNFSTKNSSGTTTYSWKNDNASIGLPATGTGNISFLAKNSGTRPITATITLTPNFSNGGVSCTGGETTFKITVNPTAQVNQPENVVSCNAQETLYDFSTVNTGGITSYTWTNTNTAIGLPSSGSGNLTFTARNPGTVPISAFVTVTPTFTNGGTGCPGASKTFKVIINPTAQVNQPVNEVVCNNNVLAVDFTTVNNSGSTTFYWSNDSPKIGLPDNGTGNISAFTAVNTGAMPVTATIRVTPVYVNGGMECNGLTKIFTITVNPIPSVLTSQKVSVCSGNTFTVVPQSGTDNLVPEGTVYTWTAPVINPVGTTTGGAAQNSAQPLISQTLTNYSTQISTATYMVTPMFGSCKGNPFPLVVTVLPSPKVEFSKANQTVCSGENTILVNLTTPTTGNVKLDWVANIPVGIVGAVATGTNAIPVQNLVNTTLSPLTITYSAKATFESDMACAGVISKYSITVNPAIYLSSNVSDYSGYNISVFGGVDGWVDVTVNGGTGNYTYSWTGPNGFTSTQQDLSNLPAGTYMLTARDYTGCTKTLSVTLTQPAETPGAKNILISSIVTHAADCRNTNSGSIDLSVSGGVPPYTYIWSNGVMTQDLSNIPAGNYTVTVTDYKGNSAKSSFEIKDQTVLIIDVTRVIHLDCATKALSLISTAKVTGGVEPYELIWSRGTVSGTNKEIMETNQNGLVVLTVKDALGCTANSSFNVNNLTQSVIDYQTIDCDRHTVQFNSILPETQGDNAQYLWIFGDGGSSIVKSPVHTFAAAGRYDVSLTITTSSCSSTFVKTFQVEQAPVLSLDRTSAINICRGDSLTVRAFGADTYRWSDGSTGDSFTITREGAYSVEGTSRGGCKSILSFGASYFDSYNFAIRTDREELSSDNRTLNVWTEDVPFSRYYWDFGDGQLAQGNNLTHVYADSIKDYLDVSLKVVNPNGCVESVTKRIWITNPELPNTITPDGDGINDIFMQGWHIQVYNRNGLLLYEGVDGWDGTYKGKLVSNDTYFYVLQYNYKTGIKHKSGFVTVIR